MILTSAWRHLLGSKNGMTACFPVRISRSLSQPWPSVREEFQNSPFFLYWLMLTWLTTGNPPENVKDYVSVMDDRQYNLYLCMTEQFQELLHVSNRSYFLLAAGTRPLWRGDYEKAAICFQRGMDQAYRGGQSANFDEVLR